MATKIPEISDRRPIVESDGSLTLQSRTYFRVLSDRALIIGEGSPEGAVPAVQGASYLDEIGSLGSVFYLKQVADIAGDPLTGWVLIG